MKKQPTRLCLKPGVTLTEQAGKIGLMLNGHTRLARDALQADILRRLVRDTPTPEGLTQQLCASQNPPRRAADVALALACFILDFQEYL